MINFIKKYFFAVFLCNFFLYSHSLEKLSGISTIIGNDIILDSEIEDDRKLFCHSNMINDFLIQKLMLIHAKQDKSIQISDQELRLKTQEFLSELKNQHINQGKFFLTEFENQYFLNKLTEEIKNKQYIDKFYKKKTDDVEVYPEEIKYFFTNKQNQISNKKICISYIIFYPKLSQIHKKRIINFLNQIKKEIRSDIDFSSKAILFSEEDSSALKGGVVKGMKINHLSNKFSHFVLSLKEGEISEPFESDLGFHLVKLEKKRKNEIDFRHIFIKPKYSKYELKKTKSFIKFFRNRIHKINIDKIPNFLIQNKIVEVMIQNPICLEENQLSKKLILSLKKEKITNPYQETINGKEGFVVIKLLDQIPFYTYKPDSFSFEKDYDKLKNFVIDFKKKETIKNWAKEMLKKTYYVKINC
ncbi:peptidylprolyl isomerase [Blattabacterium cuenoti]|uniref:peptidylprolyl isomerase n=1 Tax=Blattabacterium cuenoti TaxID=1653831 RepID=UPI00163CEB84|nr:peptidylprolyl isomerase [Blattabacterium cuenoti]